MKLLVAAFVILGSLNVQAATRFVDVNNFSYKAEGNNLDKMMSGQILFTHSLDVWSDWTRDPAHKILLPRTNYTPPEPLHVFHARSSFVVDKPASSFSEEKLHNLQFLKKVEKGNTHKAINKGFKNQPCQSLCVESTIDFPSTWATIISMGRWGGLLEEHNTGYLLTKREFQFYAAQDIEKNAPLFRGVSIHPAPMQIVSKQNIFNINQMAQFGSTLIRVQPLGENKSLITVDVVLGLESDLIQKAKSEKVKQFIKTINDTFGDLNIDPEILGQIIIDVFLGQHFLNTSAGIGSGLPNYSKEIITGLKSTLQTL